MATSVQRFMDTVTTFAALGACLLIAPSVSSPHFSVASSRHGRASPLADTGCVSKLHANFVCQDSAALSRLVEAAFRILVRELQVELVNGELLLLENMTAHLTTLDLTSSRTTAITGMQSLPLLRTLILTDNPNFNLTSLAKLGDVPSLTSLHLSGIKIGSSDALEQFLGKLPKLHTLNMVDCGLTVLDYYSFSGLATLRFLNISHNPLHTLQFNAKLLHHLEELSASNCSLETVFVTPTEEDHGLLPTKTLRLLNLSYNKLAELDPRLVYAMVERGTVDLTDNPLRHASCALFPLFSFHEAQKGGPGGVLGATEVLDGFSLANITFCPWLMCPERCVCVPSTWTVKCLRAGLTAIPPFGPSEAKVLVLDDNSISSLEGLGTNIWTKLQHLSINNNQLTSLSMPRSILPQLYHLSAVGNSIGSISTDDCPLLASLYSLNITRNKLVSIDASPCGYLRLTILDVSQNYIKDLLPLHLSSLPYLQFLNVSRNSVTVLSKRSLDKLPSLKLLDASWNHLTSIDTRQYVSSPYTSRGHRTLEQILLDHNYLSDLRDLQELGLTSTSRLRIDDNPWHCSCTSSLQSRYLPVLEGGQCYDSSTVVRDFLLNTATFCSRKTEVANGNIQNVTDQWNVWSGAVMLFAAIFLTIGVCVVSNCPRCCLPLRGRSIEPEVQIKNSLFILHHWDNIGMVDTVLVPHLRAVVPGVPLLYCDNMEIYGRPFREAFQPYLKTIGKVLVVVSESSFNHPWFRILLNKCYREHLRQDNFLMMALLMEDAPAVDVLAADRDFHFLVNDRPYVPFADGDYMRQIVQFLQPCGATPKVDLASHS